VTEAIVGASWQASMTVSLHICRSWEAACNSIVFIPVQPRMLSNQVVFGLPLPRLPSATPCRTKCANDSYAQFIWPYSVILRLFITLSRRSYGSIAFIISSCTDWFVRCSVYEIFTSFLKQRNSKAFTRLSDSAVSVHVSHPKRKVEMVIVVLNSLILSIIYIFILYIYIYIF